MILFHNVRIYIWVYRIFVNNGLVFYATWVTIATILNFNIALVYDSKGKFKIQKVIW
jgi:hypothetical protein